MKRLVLSTVQTQSPGLAARNHAEIRPRAFVVHILEAGCPIETVRGWPCPTWVSSDWPAVLPTRESVSKWQPGVPSDQWRRADTSASSADSISIVIYDCRSWWRLAWFWSPDVTEPSQECKSYVGKELMMDISTRVEWGGVVPSNYS